MAEATQFMYSHRELAEILVKAQGLHEGIWTLTITLSFGAANIGTSPEANDLSPAGVVRVQNIGLQKADEMTPLSVDASIVNRRT
jgi:hypothetical protein